MKLFNLQLDRKQYHKVMVILAAALILSVFFGYNTYKEKKQYQTFLQNQYQRAFNDLVSNVENINVLLDKADVTASAVNSNGIMTQIWRQAYSASENLGQLPITHTALAKTAKFLNQVGDFCYSISRQNAANKLMTDEQLNQLNKLRDYSAYLVDILNDMEQNVAAGNIRFGEIRKKGRLILKRASENAVDVKFGEMDKKFSDYPTMIYDGPFSDSVIEGKPKSILNEPDVDLNQAMEKARKFVGADKIGKIIESSSGKGIIPTYGLEIIPKDNDRSKSINIDVTKKGGYVLWMLNPREVPDKKLTDKQAGEKAKEFLKAQGFGNLQETFILKEDNTSTITFVGLSDEGVLIYPDQLKVKVALDNGEIVGFDAYQYLMAHRKRDIPKPKITEQEARKKLSSRIDVERVKLAIIPLPGDREQLCYEFKGKNSRSDYFIYINAENGNEENILKIIKQENGILTQ